MCFEVQSKWATTILFIKIATTKRRQIATVESGSQEFCQSTKGLGT